MTLRDTIAPKSDQLNYEDCISGPLTVTVTGLKMGSEEQPVIVSVKDSATGAQLRDFKPCKTVRRILIAAWGDKGKAWIGKSMTLYGDDGVVFGGQRVGGIRVSHMTGIDEPLVLRLTTTRSKRAEVRVLPLVIQPPAAPAAQSGGAA